MSGGHFDYKQYHLEDIAVQIEALIRSNDDESLNEYGAQRGRGYSDATINRFKIAVRLLRQAAVYAHRIDWLVSDDDGENTFHKRLEDDLNDVELRPVAALAQQDGDE